MHPTSPLIAKNIDEVIAQLQDIIVQSKKNNDRLGYFASLYCKVTIKVKEGITNGAFGPNSNIEQLDVIFANRYLYALDQWRKGQPVSKSWQVAFDASKKSSALVLQQLILGINAHINLDLGIAVVETAGSNDISGMKNDFDAINTILAALTYEVIHELNIVSPFLSVLGFSGSKSNSMLIQFSIGNARDGSWCFAEDLAIKEDDVYTKCIADRDTEIADLGQTLITSKGFMKMGIWIIHLFEWKNVDMVINVLDNNKKLYKSELPQQ